MTTPEQRLDDPIMEGIGRVESAAFTAAVAVYDVSHRLVSSGLAAIRGAKEAARSLAQELGDPDEDPRNMAAWKQLDLSGHARTGLGHGADLRINDEMRLSE